VGASGGLSAHRLDEDDVRVRPGRGSRPRTRTRPAHEGAAEGTVLAVDRGRFTVVLDDEGLVSAMRAREMGRRAVVVGDRVALVGDVTGDPGSLARIVRRQPRTSALRRTADDTDPVERVVAANADLVVIVTSLAEPPPRPRLVDRCLVAAYDAGIDALLCLTKTDLAGPQSLPERYRPLGVPVVTSGRDDGGRGLADLRSALAGRQSVLVGHSGVGKSTLVNALVPDAARQVGAVNAVTGRGRHTSSSVVAFPLLDGGWVVDTPGIRSFGLAHVSHDRIVAAFPDLAPGTTGCPPGCDHVSEGCALDQWVAAGHADPARLESLRRLIAARDAGEG
jgi:ribosome biogenesis GTPase / thiamine phosphate phosphatase